MTEAFPCDTAPRYLRRNRDKSYGPAFRHRVRAIGITEVVTAPRSPWQNPYAERLIGSIHRECLDHVIILNERHLRRVLSWKSRAQPGRPPDSLSSCESARMEFSGTTGHHRARRTLIARRCTLAANNPPSGIRSQTSSSLRPFTGRLR